MPLYRCRSTRLDLVLVVAGVLALTAGCETVFGKSDGPAKESASAGPTQDQIDENAQILTEAGRAIAQERFQDAARLLERALTNDPNNVRARLVTAELYLARGDLDVAAASFEPLSKEEPVRAEALQGWGISLLRKGQGDAADKVLREAVALDPQLWRAWNALGMHHAAERDWKAARASYDKAIALNPDSAMVRNNRAYSLMMEGEYGEAELAFAEVLKIDPTLELARTNLRLTLAWQGKYDHAIMGVSRNELPKILNNIGYIALLRKDYTAAEAYFSQAMEASASFNQTAWQNLQMLKKMQEKKDKQ